MTNRLYVMTALVSAHISAGGNDKIDLDDVSEKADDIIRTAGEAPQDPVDAIQLLPTPRTGLPPLPA